MAIRYAVIDKSKNCFLTNPVGGTHLFDDWDQADEYRNTLTEAFPDIRFGVVRTRIL